MICVCNNADIGPVSITTDPEKFQQDLQELFVQVGNQHPQFFCPIADLLIKDYVDELSHILILEVFHSLF